MYFFNIIFIPIISSSENLNLRKVLIGIPVWIIAGLGYGYSMNFYFFKRKKKKH